MIFAKFSYESALFNSIDKTSHTDIALIRRANKLLTFINEWRAIANGADPSVEKIEKISTLKHDYYVDVVQVLFSCVCYFVFEINK